MSKATQRGFTLIELVVVIVILGILAAFAVPRFVNLQSEARQASLSALEGSLRSASSLARAAWLAGGSTGNVDMEGQTIVMANGYPNRATIDNTLASMSGFTYVEGTGVFTLTGGTNCTVTYTEAAAGNTPTILADPNCQ